jgi:4-hydroxybenzoate polyprenyltransferase
MLSAIIRSMRLRQWSKNALLFAGLVFDRQMAVWPSLWATVQGFFAFGLLSSGIYMLNDIIDIQSDRAHPRKKYRPIAAGEISPARASTIALGLIIAGLFIGLRLSVGFAVISLISLSLNLAYSFWLKHIAIIDVIVLASFYVLRVAAGVTLIQVERFSPWLYVFTSFAALFLGIGKRRAEMSTVEKSGKNTRKVLEGYTAPFLDQMLLVVLTLSILTYSLYTFSAPNLPENNSLMLTIPFVIYGFFRYLYLVQVKKGGEAPEEIIFRDRPTQLTVFLWGLSVLSILYLFI